MLGLSQHSYMVGFDKKLPVLENLNSIKNSQINIF